jgi:serine phosphatase RsbU (regulator of sigma subunit)
VGGSRVEAFAEAGDHPERGLHAPGGLLTARLVGRDGSDIGQIALEGKLTGEFGTGEQVLLGEFARIASLATENARLEERERHIARTLQSSLLPPSLPEIPGIDAAARYLPGGEGTSVGGDLYDLVPVDGEWALVVGDVCGKGAEAAVLTAMVRYTLRAEVVHHVRPSEVLGLLNAAILRQYDDGRFCTLLHGRLRLRPGGAWLTMASAGHPPPLVLRADGTVETVACAGPLLGVIPDIATPDVTVELSPGDALVCYTDGVTESRGHDGLFGDRRLAEVLAGAAGGSAGALVERVTDAVLDFRGNRTQDDLALLALRVPS